jgi:hypothetical protein
MAKSVAFISIPIDVLTTTEIATIPLQIFSERLKEKNGIERLGSKKLPSFSAMWCIRIGQLLN